MALMLHLIPIRSWNSDARYGHLVTLNVMDEPFCRMFCFNVMEATASTGSVGVFTLLQCTAYAGGPINDIRTA